MTTTAVPAVTGPKKPVTVTAETQATLDLVKGLSGELKTLYLATEAKVNAAGSAALEGYFAIVDSLKVVSTNTDKYEPDAAKQLADAFGLDRGTLNHMLNVGRTLTDAEIVQIKALRNPLKRPPKPHFVQQVARCEKKEDRVAYYKLFRDSGITGADVQTRLMNKTETTEIADTAGDSTRPSRAVAVSPVVVVHRMTSAFQKCEELATKFSSLDQGELVDSAAKTEQAAEVLSSCISVLGVVQQKIPALVRALTGARKEFERLSAGGGKVASKSQAAKADAAPKRSAAAKPVAKATTSRDKKPAVAVVSKPKANGKKAGKH